MYIDIYTTIP